MNGIEVYVGRPGATGKRANRAVAHAVAPRPEYKAMAAKIYAEILAEAAKHTQTGELASHIRLKQGKTDWRIEADAEYVAHVEFGHYLGKRGQKKRRWVEGIRFMRKVVRRHGGF